MANAETPIESFNEELSKLIKHRTKYESVDFQLSHYFVFGEKKRRRSCPVFEQQRSIACE